ncbi:MAG: 30S ribosomal protein S20 [bacterium]|nr:30S ribosomal protein S20 [bacterium]
MPNHRSTEKSLRKNQKRRDHNIDAMSKLRTLVKKVRVAISNNNQEEAEASLRAAVSALDTAAKRNIIHPRNASRRKSRLMHQVAQMGQQQ